LNLAGLLEYLAIISSTLQALLVPATICAAQLQLCPWQDFMLGATSSVCCKDLTQIAVRWNIVRQNESNRKRTAYRARALVALVGRGNNHCCGHSN
jgi:hypothetical protein